MKKHRVTICIIGGMGPLAGVDLHTKIISNTKFYKKGDQGHCNIVHLSYPSFFSDRTDFLSGITKENPAKPAIKILRNHFKPSARLIIGVACNTFHADKIFGKFKLQVRKYFENAIVVSIIEETLKTLDENKNVAVLSTLGTYKHKIYSKYLHEKPFNFIDLCKKDNEIIHDVIYNKKWGLKYSNGIHKNAIDNTMKVCKKLINTEVEQIVLGCTELPFLIKSLDLKNCRFIDSSEQLALGMLREYNKLK